MKNHKWDLKVGRWKVTVWIRRTVKVVGINSELKDGNHILMWDFDDVHIQNVRRALMTVQQEYNLPDIHILNTGRPLSYHAYCWVRTPFMEALSIIAGTQYIDETFVRMGALRGYFTLRITPKDGRPIVPNEVLKGQCISDCGIKDIKDYEQYETAIKDGVV